MRRLLSILVLALFGLPSVSPLLALSAPSGSGVPVCCRAGGKHHCMYAAGAGQSAGTRIGAMREKCPYRNVGLSVGHRQTIDAPLGAGIYAGVVRHPSVVPQTERMRRVAQIRARHKRGPPVFFL